MHMITKQFSDPNKVTQMTWIIQKTRPGCNAVVNTCMVIACIYQTLCCYNDYNHIVCLPVNFLHDGDKPIKAICITEILYNVNHMH